MNLQILKIWIDTSRRRRLLATPDELCPVAVATSDDAASRAGHMLLRPDECFSVPGSAPRKEH